VVAGIEVPASRHRVRITGTEQGESSCMNYRCFAYRENPHYRPPNYPPVLAAV
jgi:hypothetical protein